MKLQVYNIVILLVFAIHGLSAQELNLTGQAIGWSVIHPLEPKALQLGARIIPGLEFQLPVGNLSLEGELSADAWAAVTIQPDSVPFDRQFSPYRAWIKLSGDQFELRAGLQKINFGSARMIRPLMWFDRLDPKDPLQLTTGVYGLLGRYYFMNNANIWLWGLYGNNNTKGLELYPSKENSIEYGGRIQLPLAIGEIAATFHARQADPDQVLPLSLQVGEPIPEYRLGLDTKIDVAIGLWMEAALIRQESELLPYTNRVLLNTGADYTFNMGNGLQLMVEGLYYQQGDTPTDAEEQIVFTGITLSYPVNIIHNISALLFIDAANGEFYRFLNWSATYDRWSFYGIFYWNPETYLLPGFEQETNLFSGAGAQIMTVFNF